MIKKKIQPQFPFGFGLTYTTFKYLNIRASSSKITKDKRITISIEIKNTGKENGAEVAQLYIQSLKKLS